MEVNSLITEQRIETLEAIKAAFENEKTPKYDKMDLKKKCLDIWRIPVLHYDQNLVMQSKHRPFQKRDHSHYNKHQNKISSIKDEETLRIYNEYDNYTDSMKSMIDMLGSNRRHESSSRRRDTKSYSRDDSRQSERSDLTSSNKKKISSSEKIDLLKQQIISNRKTEDFLSQTKAENNIEGSKNEELLKKKRDNMLTSLLSSSKPAKKQAAVPDAKKKSVSSVIKINLNEQNKHHPVQAQIKEHAPTNNPNLDIVKKKEHLVQESIKNRQIAENKRIVLDDSLKLELEKYKVNK